MSSGSVLAALSLSLFAPAASGAPRRALELQDFDRLASVDGVACAHDGSEIVYSVDQSDTDSDERKSALWMTDFEGKHDLRLTEPAESASNAKFSPDGRYVSFVASRPGDTRPQVYVLDLRGGGPGPSRP